MLLEKMPAGLLPEYPPAEAGPAIIATSENEIVTAGLALATPHFARKGASPAAVIRSTPRQRQVAKETEKLVDQRKGQQAPKK